MAKKIRKQKKVLKQYVNLYNNKKDLTQLIDLYLNVDRKKQKFLGKYIVCKFNFKTLLQAIFMKIFYIDNYKIKYYFYNFFSKCLGGKLKQNMKKKSEKYLKRIN